MKKKYPENAMKVHDLLIEYSEKVENLIDRLTMENELMGKKLMLLMNAIAVDVNEPELPLCTKGDKS